jgi:hypothetical protein
LEPELDADEMEDERELVVGGMVNGSQLAWVESVFLLNKLTERTYVSFEFLVLRDE